LHRGSGTRPTLILPKPQTVIEQTPWPAYNRVFWGYVGLINGRGTDSEQYPPHESRDWWNRVEGWHHCFQVVTPF
jgi:hypothetical protein